MTPGSRVPAARRRFLRVVSATGAAALIGAALPRRSPAATADPVTQTDTAITVFAAASLADVMAALAARPGRGGPPLRFSFAASSTLARQIEQGAPADIFISADEAWMDYLIEKKRVVAATRRVVVTNRLVVVRPGAPNLAEPPESVGALSAALRAHGGTARIATGDPAHVPAGRYAQAALTRLGLWAEVAPRLVRADNVRSALAFVERGEAAAGIVYSTDARLSSRVGAVARFPETSHPPIHYPAALVVGAAAEARDVLAEFFTPAARTLFVQAGFGKP